MEGYRIEVVVPSIDNLQQKLQAAYDHGAEGSFNFFPQGADVKIVFDREYGDDAEYIEERMAGGTSLQRAVCEQLAAEFSEEDEDAEALAPVIAALLAEPVVYDDKGIPFSAYIGFVPAQGVATA